MAATQGAIAPPAPESADSQYAKLNPGPGKTATEVAAHQRTRIHGAMIEIVAEEGYRAVTVRELARRAGVSSRAFYTHFQSKENSFLQTHELVVRRAAKRVIASQAGERDWEKRLHLAFRAFARELARDPQAARLALVEVHAVGGLADEQVLWAQEIFAAMIAESLGRSPDQAVVSPLVTRGIVAGVTSVARSHLLWSGEGGTEELGDELAQWVLCVRQGQLGGQGPPAAALQAPAPIGWSDEVEVRPRPSDRELDLILAATAKLVAGEGRDKLKLSRIRSAAGISPQALAAHFNGVEDCVVAAAEWKAADALTTAAVAKASSASWEQGVGLAMAVLCDRVAHDPMLAKLCFVELTCLGSKGLHCCERLMAEVADLISYGAPTGQSPDDIATEASAGAIWGVIKQLVLCGREQQLPQLAPTLASLALAPSRQRLPIPGLG